MLVSEMIAITTLCVYNALLLRKTYSILKQKHKLS